MNKALNIILVWGTRVRVTYPNVFPIPYTAYIISRVEIIILLRIPFRGSIVLSCDGLTQSQG